MKAQVREQGEPAAQVPALLAPSALILFTLHAVLVEALSAA